MSLMRLAFLPIYCVILCLSLPCLFAADQRSGDTNLAHLPAPDQSSVSAALGRNIAAYHGQARGNKFHFENSLQGTHADFARDGVELGSANTLRHMKLRAYGYGGMLRQAEPASPQVSLNRVEYRRAGLTEAYVNGPGGLEQGITLYRAPARRSGMLTLAFEVTGATDAGESQSTIPEARPRLVATDAEGKNLPAQADASGQQLLLKVNDAGARYPVTISYWAQLAQLVSSNYYGYHFGASVGISGDVVVVGAPYGYLVDVYIKPKGQWSANMVETAVLNPPLFTECNLFGASVAISGNTIVVGDPKNCPTQPGTAYIFIEPARGWTGTLKPTAGLTASDGLGYNQLGASVAISGDIVVAGAPATYQTNGFGAAYVFVKPAGQWINATETAKLTSSDGTANDQLGYAVATSGSTIVVGEPFGPVDGAYVYSEPASGWTNMTQTAKLTASDGPNQGLGSSVAVGSNTVVAGAPYATINSNQNAGAAYLFVEPLGGWSNATQTAKLIASNPAYEDQVGSAVALSGNTVAVGAPNYAFSGGGVIVFTKPSAGWTSATPTAILTASDAKSSSAFGASVAIEGSTIIGGSAFNKRSFDGAAYVFENYLY
jgi:hypothetical protein